LCQAPDLALQCQKPHLPTILEKFIQKHQGNLFVSRCAYNCFQGNKANPQNRKQESSDVHNNNHFDGRYRSSDIVQPSLRSEDPERCKQFQDCQQLKQELQQIIPPHYPTHCPSRTKVLQPCSGLKQRSG
jgi:hypothetical protein